MQPTRAIITTVAKNTMLKPTITAAILTKMALTIWLMDQNLRVMDIVKATRTEKVNIVLTEATAPIREALAANTVVTETITINPLPNG